MILPFSQFFSNPRLDSVQTTLTVKHSILLKVLRLDLINPQISGNKWYKLKFNLQLAQRQGHSRLLSFGGAWSNHLYALAAAAKMFDFESVGIVRGELPVPLNPVLKFALSQGMRLIPVSRADYRNKCNSDFLQQLHKQLGDFYLIPEGGSNEYGVEGCAELASHLLWETTDVPRFVLLACGTGTTMAGLLAGISGDSTTQQGVQIVGIPVLKGGDFLNNDIKQFLAGSCIRDPGNWQLHTDFHWGGYARHTQELQDFIDGFNAETGIPLEPVYTGKLFFALSKLITAGKFPAGSEVIVVHSGGIHSTE
jgi:1-aminocyclopropane-1-carboxylate deaminase